VDIDTRGLKRVVIHTTVSTSESSNLSGEVAAEDIIDPQTGDTMVAAGTDLTDRMARKIADAGVEEVVIRKTHLVPHRGKLNVEVGDEVSPGDRLTEGPLDPQKVLELKGVHGIMEYLVAEIQMVYKSQGVDINDKHVEIIVRQMLKRRRVNEAGDARFLPGQIVDKFDFEDENTRVRAQEGTEATADWLLMGITEASLATDSFLSAASFQKTTRVLTDAAVKGKRDNLVGLKENVIIGRLIPAGTGLHRYRALSVMGEEGEAIISPRELLEARGGVQEELLALPVEEGIELEVEELLPLGDVESEVAEEEVHDLLAVTDKDDEEVEDLPEIAGVPEDPVEPTITEDPESAI
jgi:DNA-directed RNA polymerase subunit beta'